MKRILSLACIVGMLLMSVASASAADLTVRGYWWLEAVNQGNWDFLKKGAPNGEDTKFHIEQKMRTAFYFTANENLRAILDTQIGTQNWGAGLYGIGAGRSVATNASPSAGTAGNGNIMLRKAYIEFKVPNTKVNTSVGFQTVTLPAAFGGGSAIFDDQVASAVVSAPITENVSLTGGYARAAEGTNAPNSNSAFDVAFLAAPITFTGFKIQPFAAYGHAGASSGAFTATSGFVGPNSSLGNGVNGYWGGVAFNMDILSPFKVMADFNYGKATYNNNANAGTKGNRSGWLFDVAVDYTGLSWMTPQVFFTYSSGENGNSSKNDGSERMPVIGTPQNWTVGSFFFGERLELAGSINTTAGYTKNTLGFWAAGIALKNITFMDKLTHDFNLLYAKGTNNKDFVKESGGTVRGNYGGMLTTKDSLVEVDLNTRYKFYDELTGYVYLGYIFADFDKEVWGTSSLANAAEIRQYGSANAYKIGVGLNYFF